MRDDEYNIAKEKRESLAFNAAAKYANRLFAPSYTFVAILAQLLLRKQRATARFLSVIIITIELKIMFIPMIIGHRRITFLSSRLETRFRGDCCRDFSRRNTMLLRTTDPTFFCSSRHTRRQRKTNRRSPSRWDTRAFGPMKYRAEPRVQ